MHCAGSTREFHAHTVTALTGPSGSGKSTLLTLLALRDRPSGGDVTILGRNASSLGTRERRAHSRRTIAWVPQRPTDGVYPHLTAAQNVEQAARWRGAPARRRARAARAARAGAGGDRAGIPAVRG